MNVTLENILCSDAMGDSAVTRLRTASKDTNAFKEMFSSLLQERRDNLQDTLKELEKKRQETEELETMRQMPEVEIIRRIMPDGSIMVTEYRDGKVASRYRKTPHMVEMPDPNAPIPRNAQGDIIVGQQKMKQVPKFSLFEDLM